MYKKIISLLLVTVITVTLAVTTASCKEYTDEQVRMADALNHIGLFLGTGKGYELERKLNRAESITLVVRMLGQEKTASEKTYNIPFTDVDDWAVKYVGYAYENKLTFGRSATIFDSKNYVSDNEFITFVLRALGYDDRSENPQFNYKEPYKLSKNIGLIKYDAADGNFNRGDSVEIFWNALMISDKKLAKDLVSRGVFTEKKLEEAIEIYTYGEKRTESGTAGGSSSGGSSSGGSFSGGSSSSGSSSGSSSSGNSTPEKVDPNDDQMTSGTGPDKLLTFEEYNALDPKEAQEYFMSFPSADDFFEWLEKAEAEYEEANPKVEIGQDENIDIGDILNP